MNTLIIYASKKGGTKRCAEYIKKGIKGQVKFMDCKTALDEKLESYDTIIMGSGVYAGSLDKDLKTFCSNNEADLISKNTYLFLGCMNETGLNDYIKNNIPEKLHLALKDVTWCGGAFYFSKMNFFERFIIKKIANAEKKQKGETDRVDGKTDIEMFQDTNIEALIKKINGN